MTAMAQGPGWVYLVHLERPIGDPDNPRGQARHYAGSAREVAARLAEHATGQGARLLAAALEQGVRWHLVREWPGGRAEERALKEAHNAPRFCPECAARAGRRPQRELPPVKPRQAAAQRHAAAEAQAQRHEVLRGHAAIGREDATRFLALLDGASADEIQAAAAELQTPYYEGERTPEGDARQGAFAGRVTAAIDRLRESKQAQTAAATQPQEGTPEVSTDTAQERQPAEPETRPATEWMKGAKTAHDLITRQVEAGYSATASPNGGTRPWPPTTTPPPPPPSGNGTPGPRKPPAT